jgi:E3 ubiquitin-protein ligase RGLG
MGETHSRHESVNSRNTNTNHRSKFGAMRYETYEELEQGLRTAGLESCQLIVGIDFTKSNEWQGGLPYYQEQNLHSVFPYPNPYQQVLEIICKSLVNFDDDGLIPAYGFGDTRTTNQAVFSFVSDDQQHEQPCLRLEGVLQIYNKIVIDIGKGFLKMSGPTSFVPIIHKAINVVGSTKQYHILLIICDGAVNDKAETIKAIVQASYYPLSIICIGVGKGPWDIMEHFDDHITNSKFDNFHFVNFHKMMEKCENVEVEFAKNALMEIPAQFNYIKKHLM